ncbi:MAG: phosphate acyltransferase [Firmicutes bacterium]|nr:phosphate acyltransferase [Bacillota bacterium]
MAYRNFEEMVQQVKAAPVMRDLAVAAAADKPVLEAAIRALREGIANPIFVGSAEKITALLQELGEDPKQFRIQDCAEGEEGQAAVELVKDGKASLIMKGLMETRQILSPVVKKENGLRTGELMSHVVFFQLPNYHKLLMTTDGGMVIYPSLEEKVHIVENAVTALHAMGYENPKLAVVAGIEKVNPKMPETTDAAALKQMNQEGKITGCTIEGPISYDIAMDPQIAKHKGFAGGDCGDFDCLIMPNLVAGNILGKCYTVTVGAPMAGVIMGAKVPIIMTSRGSDENEKFYSIVMAARIAMGGNK